MRELKGKKVLVTGGAGFIGSHIVDRLLDIGAQITVVDNLSTGKLENIAHNLDKIKFIQKDFTDNDLLENVLGEVEFISHQAALRSVPKSMKNPLEYHQINVTGTLKLLLKAKEKGVQRVAIASSSSVYGERHDFPEKESDLPVPISPYAATKLMTEYYAYLFSKSYGLEVVSLRYFNVFGPRQSLDDEYAVVIPKFINSIFNNKRPPIYGDGEQERDFAYIDDVAKANIAALMAEGIGGQVFNVAGGNPQSVNSLFKALKEIIAKNVEPEYLEPRLGDVRKTHADIEKTKKLLDWQPEIDFYEGLKRTVEGYGK
ncbi:MAG: SDR family oxidoreductase [Candidatus Omnitrophota bacterium]